MRYRGRARSQPGFSCVRHHSHSGTTSSRGERGNCGDSQPDKISHNPRPADAAAQHSRWAGHGKNRVQVRERRSPTRGPFATCTGHGDAIAKRRCSIWWRTASATINSFRSRPFSPHFWTSTDPLVSDPIRTHHLPPNREYLTGSGTESSELSCRLTPFVTAT